MAKIGTEWTLLKSMQLSFRKSVDLWKNTYLSRKAWELTFQK